MGRLHQRCQRIRHAAGSDGFHARAFGVGTIAVAKIRQLQIARRRRQTSPALAVHHFSWREKPDTTLAHDGGNVQRAGAGGHQRIRLCNSLYVGLKRVLPENQLAFIGKLRLFRRKQLGISLSSANHGTYVLFDKPMREFGITLYRPFAPVTA